MIRAPYLIAALALALSACGESNAPTAAAPAAGDGGKACALLGDVTKLFGAGAVAEGGAGIDGMAGVCRVQSADARLAGDIIVYEGGDPAARFDEAVAKWDTFTETPLAPVEGLGDAAQIALDLPGYQTQIVFRKGERVVLIAGHSGDEKITGETLAREMAKTAASAP